ncbi:uncharacterized protein LOC107022445 [Solanum pennellii]|uniref:Uncharacterized protein LOC107022445 n=1 Tax=Solanum pennellii TaxID=28526 RepID=A0ABM1H078_SOLPN|nr:uncharacterized protein LOC107022445 [Solanum pennellii]
MPPVVVEELSEEEQKELLLNPPTTENVLCLQCGSGRKFKSVKDLLEHFKVVHLKTTREYFAAIVPISFGRTENWRLIASSSNTTIDELCSISDLFNIANAIVSRVSEFLIGENYKAESEEFQKHSQTARLLEVDMRELLLIFATGGLLGGYESF